MPNERRSSQPRDTDDILREMEEMAKEAGTPSRIQSGKTGGGLKSLLDFFVKVVPEEDESPKPAATPQAPAPAATQRSGPRVADLVAGEPEPKFKPPKTVAADLSQRPFDEIYREAGIANSPCTVDELAQLMENPAVANQPLGVKVIAVNLALSAKGISHEVPIADAVRRDRALDAFQAMLDERSRTAEQRNHARIQQLAQEAEEYLKRKQAEMEALRAETAEAKRQTVDFSLRREAEEKRLANLITPFLEGKPNPVSVGDQTPGEQTQSPAAIKPET